LHKGGLKRLPCVRGAAGVNIKIRGSPV